MINRLKSLAFTFLTLNALNKLRYAKGYILSLPQFGKKFQCPICKGTFRIFLKAGENQRNNAACPRCGSLERQRLIWMYLKENSDIFRSKIKILHIAPEFCFQRVFSSLPNLGYISVDLHDNYAMVKMDITDISFNDNTFDCILCSHVLEHIVDDQRAMSELFRVMKPNGFGIFNVPIKGENTFEDSSISSPEKRLKHFGQKDHCRIYGKDFKERLEGAGFSVKVEPFLDSLDIKNIDYFRLLPDNEDKEDIYIGFKGKVERSAIAL